MQLIIDQLRKIIKEYAPQLKQLSDEDFSYKPLSDKWSRKEILGHLIDSAHTNIRRFIVAQYVDKPYIVYEQEYWVAAAGYQYYAIKDLIDLWMLTNKHIVMIFKNIPETALNREVKTHEIRTIEWLAADYNKHQLHHLHEILQLKPVAYP